MLFSEFLTFAQQTFLTCTKNKFAAVFVHFHWFEFLILANSNVPLIFPLIAFVFTVHIYRPLTVNSNLPFIFRSYPSSNNREF